jgi:hypothetical protein
MGEQRAHIILFEIPMCTYNAWNENKGKKLAGREEAKIGVDTVCYGARERTGADFDRFLMLMG